MIKGAVCVVSVNTELGRGVEEDASSTSVVTAPELLCVSPHILPAEAETAPVNSDRVMLRVRGMGLENFYLHSTELSVLSIEERPLLSEEDVSCPTLTFVY